MNEIVSKEMINLKDLIQIRRFYVILTFALLICMPLPAFAADVDVSVTVSQVLCIEYTGDPVIYFNIGPDDFGEESEGQPTEGYITWWSNIEDWWITVQRTEWEITNQEEGAPEATWYLEVKWGPPDNSPWVRIYPYLHPDGPSVFASSADFDPSKGTDVCEGIDWKVKDLEWEGAPPGTYKCTVTFTIVSDPPV